MCQRHFAPLPKMVNMMPGPSCVVCCLLGCCLNSFFIGKRYSGKVVSAQERLTCALACLPCPGALKPGSVNTLEPVKEDDAGGGPLLGFKSIMSARVVLFRFSCF